MMKSYLLELQQSIYDALTNHTNLISRISGVYDFVDEGTVYPTVTLGGTYSNAWDTRTWYGEEVIQDIHIWSQYKGKKEVLEIMKEVIEALDHLEDRPGATISNLRIDGTEVFYDPDGLTIHGVVKLRIKIKE